MRKGEIMQTHAARWLALLHFSLYWRGRTVWSSSLLTFSIAQVEKLAGVTKLTYNSWNPDTASEVEPWLFLWKLLSGAWSPQKMYFPGWGAKFGLSQPSISLRGDKTLFYTFLMLADQHTQIMLEKQDVVLSCDTGKYMYPVFRRHFFRYVSLRGKWFSGQCASCDVTLCKTGFKAWSYSWQLGCLLCLCCALRLDGNSLVNI